MYKACILSYAVALCLCNAADSIGPYVVEWQRSFGGALDDVPAAIRELPSGGFVIAGQSTSLTNQSKTSPLIGESDGWVMRLDSAGNKLWDRAIGGTNIDLLLAVELTTGNGIIVAGASFSLPGGTKTSTNYGGEDFWVARLDGAGNQLWERSFGGADDDFATAIRQTADGGFLVAGTSFSAVGGSKTSTNFGGGDFWVVRLDANGTKLWDRSFGGSNLEELTALQLTADGGFLLGGSSLSTNGSGTKISTNFGNRDLWLVRLDSNGNALWDRSYGGTSRDELRSLEPSIGGGYVLGGYSASGATGNRTVSSFGFSDYWVVRINDVGNILWDSAAGGMDFEFPWGAHQMQDGDVVSAGFSISPVSGSKTSSGFGGADFWLVGMNSQGAKLWDASLGGDGSDELYAMRRTADGSIILAGSSSSSAGTGTKTSPAFGGPDFWILKLGLPRPNLETVPQTLAQIQQNGYRLLLEGQTNLTYVIEASTDLQAWTSRQTNRLTSAQLSISDSTAAQRQFYRARILR